MNAMAVGTGLIATSVLAGAGAGYLLAAEESGHVETDRGPADDSHNNKQLLGGIGLMLAAPVATVAGVGTLVGRSKTSGGAAGIIAGSVAALAGAVVLGGMAGWSAAA